MKKIINELKPCPFCGGKNMEINTCKGIEECASFEACEENECYTVICNFNQGGCGASSGYREAMKEAVDAWNRRISVDTGD